MERRRFNFNQGYPILGTRLLSQGGGGVGPTKKILDIGHVIKGREEYRKQIAVC